MKNHKQTNGIRIALFATFLLLASLNLSAQYKLELEWQKKLVENIASITKSDNDSLLYVASANKIRTIRTSDGEVTNEIPVDAAYNLILSRNGNTLAAAGNWGVGILDPQTFKRIYWDSVYSSDFRSLSFNEQQNKIVISGKSYVGKRETFIRVYDLSTKSLFKEFPPSYFGDIGIKNAAITDDGKYVIYGYETYTDQSKQHFFVKMIDMDGKLIKDFGETSSSKFTTTNDAKTLIYFDSKAMHFFDIENMKEIEGIPIGGADPEKIEMSSDGKFMLAGYGGGLVYYDLETKKSFFLNENSTWDKYLLSKDNSNLYLAGSKLLLKFNMKLENSISAEEKLTDYRIQSMDNDLILTNSNSISPNLQFKILTLDGKLFKMILPNEIQFTPNRAIIDISNLNAGTYFLQIIDGSSSISSLKFMKIN